MKAIDKEELDRIDEIIRFNLTVLDKWNGYTRIDSLKKYLKNSREENNALRKLLRQLYRFVSNVNVREFSGDRENDQFTFYVSTHKITHDIRKKTAGLGDTSRKVNLLCALGLLIKVDQTDKQNRKELAFLHTSQRYPVNAYKIKKYDESYRSYMNERAERLLKARVTPSNISGNYFYENGLEDLAKEVFPYHNIKAVQKKQKEWNQMSMILDFIIEEQGYATRRDLMDNFTDCDDQIVSDSEIKKLLKIYKNRIDEKYLYRRPNKEEKAKFGLTKDKFIYIPNPEYVVDPVDGEEKFIDLLTQ